MTQDDPCCNLAQSLVSIDIWFWQIGSERYIQIQLSLVHQFEHSIVNTGLLREAVSKMVSAATASPVLLSFTPKPCSQVVFPLRIKAIDIPGTPPSFMRSGISCSNCEETVAVLVTAGPCAYNCMQLPSLASRPTITFPSTMDLLIPVVEQIITPPGTIRAILGSG